MRQQDQALWPAHANVARVFSGMQTQWRFGPAGARGMDYTALPLVLRKLRLRCGRADFERLQIMEAEALQFFSEQRDAALRAAAG